MTPLRRRMIEDLCIRGLAQNTIDSYIGAVERFARHFGRSPEVLGRKEIRLFQVHMVYERKISTATLNVYTSALRFLYNVTLGKDWNLQTIPYAKTPKRLPGVLTQIEVLRPFAGITNLKHRALVMTTYAAGLRASEVAHLRICDIDSARMLIHIEQGKGARDRLAPLAAALVAALRSRSASDRSLAPAGLPAGGTGGRKRVAAGAAAGADAVASSALAALAAAERFSSSAASLSKTGYAPMLLVLWLRAPSAMAAAASGGAGV